MADWQPIETAPKAVDRNDDPIRVLACDSDGYVEILFWCQFRNEWNCADGIKWEPTHWQPLPAPPSEERK